MGGGDLNSKKAWHPNTLKNQERVWKAEQAAAEEEKRIKDLQRERAEQRDRDELNEMAKRNLGGGTSSNDNRLHWMYDKPDKQVQQEDYLLGKSISTTHDQADNKIQDVIPAVARRVVGSSMLTTSGDTQVDLARKLREDPLLLIKERERAARAALLNNPMNRQRITELLRKEQNHAKEMKDRNKAKKKCTDLDNILAAKLNALGEKGVNLTSLLASDDSSSDSSSSVVKHRKNKRKKEEKKKKKKEKHSKKKHHNSSDLETQHKNTKKVATTIHNNEVPLKDSTSTQTKSLHSEGVSKRSKRDDVKERRTDLKRDRKRRCNSSDKDERRHSRKIESKQQSEGSMKSEYKSNRRVGMSEEEKAAKLAEMAAAGAEREIQRGRRVAHQIAQNEAADKSAFSRRYISRNEAHALPDSLESRIHSNRHYIQRDVRHMNEHFARR